MTEQLDANVSGLLQMQVDEDGTRQPLDFYINWSRQRGHAAEQQMSWIDVPERAEWLWKPDSYAFSIPGKRPDRKGSLRLQSISGLHHSIPVGDVARSLWPSFKAAWVKLEDGATVARLWSASDWTADLYDRRGRQTGTLKLLLPGQAAAQSLFGRMRTELKRLASEPARHCQAIESYDGLEDIAI